jgi:hypothetical protein
MTIVTSKRNVNVNVNPRGLAIWGRKGGREAGALHMEGEGYICHAQPSSLHNLHHPSIVTEARALDAQWHG